MAATTNEADKYEVVEKIGHGSFGIIHKVRRKTDSKILCRKEIEYVRMSQKEREQLHAEFSILSSLRHPNIVAYYHRDHLKPRQELHLYMEYCGGGDLGRYIKGLKARRELADEAFVWSIVSQLVTALYRCHNGEDPPEVGNNVMSPPKSKPHTGLQQKTKVVILHRDLKPENVFLGEDDQVKLGDFGLSKLIQSNDFASTYVGTPYYMSPEICAAERYGPHSDIWSLGCIIYELCKQAPPFDAKTHYHLVQKIKQGRVEPLPDAYSPELQSLIKSCLNVNPQRRPDTWTLIQMPVIRLMRKEKEVVDLGKLFKQKEVDCLQKTMEAEALMVSLDQDKKSHRVDVEAQLRREWEVKARLEIDRQVALEKARLQKLFEDEVQRQVTLQVEARFRDLQAQQAPDRSSPEPQMQEALGTSSPTDKPNIHLVSISTAGSLSGPSTDPSFIDADSPATAASLTNPVRKTRTPFQRARTTNNMDSPADVHMTSPSPMSIASLSLSPRRARALNAAMPNANVFHAAAAGNNLDNIMNQRARWQPQQLSPMTSDDEEEHPSPDSASEDEFEDGVPELPSPTRARCGGNPVPDPFKVRPGMKRQKTAPTHRMGVAPAPVLFSAQPNPPTSPTRLSGARRPLGKAHTAIAAGKTGDGGEDMLKAAIRGNMAGYGGNNIVGASGGNGNAVGRTLVELNQGRTAPPAATGVAVRENRVDRVGGAIGLEEVARWDPEETPDMPSPFIRRGGRMLVR